MRIALVVISLLIHIVSGFSSRHTVRSFTRNNAGVSIPSSASVVQQRVAIPTNRGGGAIGSTSTGASGESKCPFTASMRALSSLWGVSGVLYILAKAIKRVLPIALEPFQGDPATIPLSQWQFGLYIVTVLWFCYVEGYKGFQTKFSPLVVKRAFTLVPGESHILHILFGPFYSMGLFHATKKRMIVSWSVTIGVAAIVAIVKRFPYPYRNIVDAGVVAGLTWGSLSILLLYVKSWITGKPPSIDPALPVSAIIQKKT